MEFKRESIFSGSLRAFWKSTGVVLGATLGLVIVLIAFAVILGPNYLPPKSTPIIMPDAKGQRSLLSLNTPAVLYLNIQGVIGLGDMTSEKVTNLLLDSREDFLKDGRVKAILLNINSPGGTVIDADGIYRALMDYKAKYKVPIYAYVDGLCASGGIYIACAADQIYATPSSIIGSVGTRFGPLFNVSELMAKYGVGAVTLTQGKDKDEYNPYRPWTPDEGASLKPIIATLYARFVSIVTNARPKLTTEALTNDYGARVFVAQEAAKLGYIDEPNSDYNQTLNDLVKAAGLNPEESYQVVQLTPSHNFLEDFTSSVSLSQMVRSFIGFPAAHFDKSELQGKMLYYYEP
jgi:signal peptide peptidase SppA